jgi:gamma-glutamylcyclotransferase (GGCT)/AIG2-like uncharacterized protein YtfP
MTTLRYFAYGMNMSPSTMGGATGGQAAYLDGYRLAWRGYADVEPHEGSVVPGVVWDIDADMLGYLDAREGYPSLYGRETVRVTTADGEHVDAIVYRMTDDTTGWYRRDGRGGIEHCSPHYVGLVADGRRAFGLPTDDLTTV